MIRVASLLGVLFLSVPSLHMCVAQHTKEPVSLEVATIKPADPAARNQGFDTTGRHIKIENQDLTALIMFAYGVHSKQILDEPKWTHDRYDVSGVLDSGGDPSREDYQSIVRQLLRERFGLKFHYTKRVLPVYEITIAKNGPHLEKSLADEAAQPQQTGSSSADARVVHYSNNSMKDFAFGLQYDSDRPVVDKTGLEGRYNFTLKWTPVTAKPLVDHDYPALFTAVREQLGLSIKAATSDAEVLAIDEVSPPSAN